MSVYLAWLVFWPWAASVVLNCTKASGEYNTSTKCRVKGGHMRAAGMCVDNNTVTIRIRAVLKCISLENVAPRVVDSRQCVPIIPAVLHKSGISMKVKDTSRQILFFVPHLHSTSLLEDL